MDANSEGSAADAMARGKAIQQRRLRHGIKSLHEFAEASGVSRKAVTAAENGHASEATYLRLENWLDHFEEETGANDAAVTSQPDAGRVVTFQAEGVFGAAKISVQGPVEDQAELAALFSRLIAQLKDQPPTA